MPWDDAVDLESDLNKALAAFDWPEVDALCAKIVARVSTDPEQLPESTARRLMRSLRRKRRFRPITLLAEALIQSGLRTPEVRRQYAQALIDQGTLLAAESVLREIIQDPQGVAREQMEARGLTARIYKQLYVNNNDPASPRNRSNLERALGEYLHVYRLDPRTHLWHGINAVALAARARRDGLPDAGLPDAAALAAEIVATLDKSEEEGGDIRAWDEATRMEAYVALGRQTDAVKTAQRYLDALDVDAFELQSTIRQLVEVWQLKDTEPPGSLLLPLLRAGLLRKEGAVLGLDPRKVVAEAAAANDATKGLEAIFGTDKMVTFDWYRKGLAQCSAVARVEQRNGTGHGTGWLVKAADFFPGWEGVLVLTNDHVVSETPNPHAIFPEDSQVNFQALGEKYEVERVVWSSSFREMDAAFLKLRPNANGEPKAEPLRLHERAMAMAEPTPRMYIIGHPAGRDLELSLQDNLLVASNDTLLHYRTPTEPGSSGSPVFEPLDWRVVALHHKGSRTMRRIDGGDGTYEANEGIAILSIRKQTQSAGLAPPPSAGG